MKRFVEIALDRAMLYAANLVKLVNHLLCCGTVLSGESSDLREDNREYHQR